MCDRAGEPGLPVRLWEDGRTGEERSERLDIVPAQQRVNVTARPKCACRVCVQGVVQAPAPARLIEGALLTEGAIAHVLVAGADRRKPDRSAGRP